MINRRTERFRKCFARLPAEVQRQARDAYRDFTRDPSHPALHFKPTRRDPSVYSVRINESYRALGTRNGDRMVWFWIGSHSDYIRMIGGL